VCVHVRGTASLHFSICNYWKLPNVGSNKADTCRRQLIDIYGVPPKTVYFVNICETLRFILLLDSYLLLDFHSYLFLSGFPTKDITTLIFVIYDFHISSPSYS